MTELVVVLAVLVLIAAAAPRYGVDSRSAYAGRRASPLDDLRAAGRATGRVVARLVRGRRTPMWR